MTLLARVSASGVLAVLVESVLAFGSWRLLPDARWALWVPTASYGLHFGNRWDCSGLWPYDVSS